MLGDCLKVWRRTMVLDDYVMIRIKSWLTRTMPQCRNNQYLRLCNEAHCVVAIVVDSFNARTPYNKDMSYILRTNHQSGYKDMPRVLEVHWFEAQQSMFYDKPNNAQSPLGWDLTTSWQGKECSKPIAFVRSLCVTHVFLVSAMRTGQCDYEGRRVTFFGYFSRCKHFSYDMKQS